MAACVNAKKIEKTEKFFQGQPQKESIEGVWISYKIVVNSVGEMGSLDTAFLMLDEWKKNGLEPDSVTLNTLFNGFYNNGRILDGEKIWWMTKIKNVIPEIRSYNSRLSGTCNDGKLEEAEWWCQNMIGASGTSCRQTWKPPWNSASCYIAIEELLHLTATFPHGFSWPLLLCVKGESEVATFGGILAGTGIAGVFARDEHI
jgi:pentatricopeptide repeat protein